MGKPNDRETHGNPLDSIFRDEEAKEKRRKLDCQEECKKKLSPRDSIVLDKYFTGIIIRSPEDEPLSDVEIKNVRKSLAEELGVAPETIRTIAHRSKEFVYQCTNKCLKRGEK
jgi:hypothetical protein